MYQVKDAQKRLKTLCGCKAKQNTPQPENINTYVNDMNVFFAKFERHHFSDISDEVMSEIKSNTDEKKYI